MSRCLQFKFCLHFNAKLKTLQDFEGVIYYLEMRRMDVTTLIILVITGLIAGVLGGSLGVGGAIIVIPSLVLILGLTQQEAQGTSLAFMIPPIGILAALNYYKHGLVNWKYALILSLTFMVGAYFGSKIVMNVPERLLKRIFGVVLLYVSYKMIVGK